MISFITAPQVPNSPELLTGKSEGGNAGASWGKPTDPGLQAAHPEETMPASSTQSPE